MTASITYNIIDTLEAWNLAEPEWNQLVKKSSAPSIFLTYEYLQSAWSAYGNDATLHVVTMYVDKELAGIVPLKITSRKVCGISTTTIQPIGGEEAEGNYFIVLCDEDVFYDALSEYLVVHSSDLWSKVFFDHLNSKLTFISVFSALCSKKMNVIVEQQNGCIHPFIAISTDWGQYLNGLNHKFLHNLRSKVRRACNEGNLQVISFHSPSEIKTYLDQYVELEYRSWKSACASGISRTECLRALYRDMLCRSAQEGWSELTFLTLDGRILAGGIGVSFCNRYTYLQTVYDSTVSHFSPGLILMTINVWRAYRAGLTTVDFMGNYVDYKRNWSNGEWQSSSLCIRKRFSGEGLAYLISHFIKPAVAWLSRRLPKHNEIPKLEPSYPQLKIAADTLSKHDNILENDEICKIFQIKDSGLEQEPYKISTKISLSDNEVNVLLAERSQARKNSDWRHADAIRDKLLEHGVILNDTANSTEWSRANHAASIAFTT